jgi:hypothetical protein
MKMRDMIFLPRLLPVEHVPASRFKLLNWRETDPMMVDGLIVASSVLSTSVAPAPGIAEAATA